MSQTLHEPPSTPDAPVPLGFEAKIAKAVVSAPYRAAAFAIVMTLLCIGLIATKIKVDTEILNLLPQRFDSVKALKVFDREFSQAQELTFALYDPEHTSDLETFAELFGEQLRKEPWVVRVMDRSPMDRPEGITEVQKLAVPLLLNLPPEEFKATLQRLDGATITDRFAKKRAEMEAGSPKAQMELNFDPLGIVLPALKPLAGSFNLEDSPRPLASEDGTLRIAVAVTNIENGGAPACQEMMAKVEAFKEKIVGEWEAENVGPAPQILVTGRIPYVAEMSLLMEHDVKSTILGSVILVAGVFFLGFRQIRPLFAIFTTLLLICLATIASGTLLFESLNAVTMGVCAIMIGMGVDFGMLLFGTYRSNRGLGQSHEEAATNAVALLGRGILFGACTAATSFLSLTLSESPGFIQLGALIGIGVVLSALMMMTLFFVLLGANKGKTFKEQESSRELPGRFSAIPVSTLGYTKLIHRYSKAIALLAFLGLILLNVFAYSPLGKVTFESNPKSLEPADSKAGIALRTIMAKLPTAQEPVLAVVQAKSAEEFHTIWNEAQTQWAKAKESGAIKNLITPAAFAVAPERQKANLALLQEAKIEEARTAFTQALEKEGFAPEAFEGALGLLTDLETLKKGDTSPLDWRKSLPQGSTWIFVLDRFLAPTPNVGVAYITPHKTLASGEEQAALRAALGFTPPSDEAAPFSGPRLTGWSYVITDLIPWSKGKLTQLSLLMILFIVTVLAFIYRSFAPLAVLMSSLALCVGAMIAILKITHIPLNLFNVLAFPLVLGIGVDYGIYAILAVRQKQGPKALATIVKPIIMSGLTTIAGFGSLGFANNPALSTLGLVCAIGVACCLGSTLLLILPAYLWRDYR